MKFGQKSTLSSKKWFDSELTYNKKYYNGKISTNFHKSKVPKEGSQYICLSVILIDSIYRKDKKYYRGVFLEEFKYLYFTLRFKKYARQTKSTVIPRY